MMYLSAVRAQVRNFANKFIKNERGVTAIEYAAVAAGVSAVALTIFNRDDGAVHNMLENIFFELKSKLVNIIVQ
ncbi:Flp family type IVb pilin [Gilliamella sp. B2776]|uniref:Flp family type IVb pilin n=1 Tax=unclassified Gilliamella TaxID=2685620 RepID=UPI00226A35EF|nr:MULTISPECIES: Flp family type IVb pilin [unclassified Gilliamella]MCX8649053.1 Flp family type IVb pilin [Gilliamella sp. B2779]MCX8653071.1 Flp family type IVb pilin [Gilliamella sp. B2737]MCX8655330.1 Flp family type IVb pilin [Gilliamella sp. B2894]MCX8664813.1 Flp family type IVb pilin [Gilliamella sp. B2887]MCX8690865.1 Flp family type IVb pilin [Gilliamella sp. B2776]